MEKVLSQEEINALFSAMSSEELSLGSPPEKPSDSYKVDKYDFHRADRVSQEQMRSVHLLHEHFGRNFASSLSAYLRAFVEVNPASLEQIPYSEFVKSLPDPTLFASIGIRPLDGNFALELNPSLVFPIIDMLLGGPGRAAMNDRSMTEIELNVVESVLTLAMRDLREAWRPIMEFDFSVDDKGTKAQMFQIVSPGETVIAVHLELRIGDNSGTLNLCVPSRVVKLLRNRFDKQWNMRRPRTAAGEGQQIFESVKTAPLLIGAEMRSSRLSVDDLLKISIGDVIELNERLGDPAALCVGGVEKFLGRILARRGKRSLEISEPSAG